MSVETYHLNQRLLLYYYCLDVDICSYIAYVELNHTIDRNKLLTLPHTNDLEKLTFRRKLSARAENPRSHMSKRGRRRIHY
jgi:hypothetical protein